jgi:anthranilate phosphoribosyltransferase
VKSFPPSPPAPETPARFATLFPLLTRGGTPDLAHVRAGFEAILAGAWTPVQVAAFAVVLRLLGETTEAIVAGAEALRGTMTVVETSAEGVLDTCGTGGDGLGTLNLSTAAAVVVASLGVPVAKHGNRSVSSRSGSADVVEALGIPIDVPPHRQARVLAEAGIAFLFAPAHHPALRHAAEARRELGIRTVFNALGPLANPARATRQLVGVYDDALRPVFARALARLGVERAWVVRGEDGLDEVSPSGPTRVSELSEGRVEERVIVPEDFGLTPTPPASIAGGDARANAEAISAILEGRPHPAREAVILNAAAALVVARGLPPRDAAAEARRVLDDGDAHERLERWKRVAKDAKVR